jgi:tetratricopeptide (TPR) repeat protein
MGEYNGPMTALTTGTMRLDTGRLTLARLPLDQIPSPADLPSGSIMPFLPDPGFVGRAGELRRLAALMKEEPAARIVLTGIAGIGKSRLAAEFAHRYGKFFAGGVFWLACGAADALPEQVAACGGPALHENFETLPQAAQLELMRTEWLAEHPRLLLFEDCEDEAILARWFPAAGGCRVLITSRKPDWPLGMARTMALQALPQRDSMAMLRRYRPDLGEEDHGLAALADELKGLPLALKLAGCQLGRLRYERQGLPSRYLEELRDLRKASHPASASAAAADNPAPVAELYTLSAALLEDEGPAQGVAKAVLLSASSFSPGTPIPRPLLRASLRLAEDDDDANAVAEEAFARTIELALLEPCADGALSIHPLVAEVAREQAGAALAPMLDAVEGAVLAEANRLNALRRSSELAAWRQHLRSVAEAALRRESPLAGSLLSALGVHLDMIGEKREALGALERGLGITARLLSRDHPTTARRLVEIGVVLRELGELPAARRAFEEALRIQEKVFGPLHPGAAVALGHLGQLLRAQGDLTGARVAFTRATEIDERVFGVNHPTVSRRLSSLGGVLRALGDLDGARAAHERALRIDERALGARHPHLAVCLSNLAVVQHDLGMPASARSQLERAILIDEMAHGPTHPHLAICLSNLAVVLRESGDGEDARAALERALRISEAQRPQDPRAIAAIKRQLERLR